jgi:hypothetical protein
MASRPKFGNHRSSERAIIMSQQNTLNQRAVEPCKWIAKHMGNLNLKDGSYTWQMQGFSIHLKDEHLTVTRLGNEVILDSNNATVNGSISEKQIVALEQIVQSQTQHLAKQNQLYQEQRRQQQQRKSLNKKGRSR